MKNLKEYIGEFTGTFILVFFGCGSVAGAVLFGAFSSLWEVAIIWGLGVALAIYCTRNVCPAHLNPAVSVAMTIAGKLAPKKLPIYVLFQFFGAFSAGALLYFIFKDSLLTFETANSIVRGNEESVRSAMMFGEFFPNPGFEGKFEISWIQAMLLEGIGTFILVFAIFRLTEKEEQINNFTPLLIGLTVTIIICIIAPFTQAGLNPARDFGPRLVAYFSGWGEAAFPEIRLSFFTVYILGPVIGGILARYAHKLFSLNR
jgi:glycerol uptake facilitator protein